MGSILNSKYKIKTISGRGQEIMYERINDIWNISWGHLNFEITNDNIQDILNNFFIDPDKWYSLGASMDNPVKGGLGEYIKNNIDKLTSRHASAIAAILYNEHLISIKGKKPIYLRKNNFMSSIKC